MSDKHYRSFLANLQEFEQNPDFARNDFSYRLKGLEEIRSDFELSDEVDSYSKKLINSFAEKQASLYRIDSGKSLSDTITKDDLPYGIPDSGSSEDEINEWRDNMLSFANSAPVTRRQDIKDFTNQARASLIREERGKDTSRIGDLGYRFLQGFSSGLLRGFGANETAQSVEEFIPENPKFDDSFVSKLAQGGGDLGASIGIFATGSLITGSPAGGLALSFGTNSIRRYNDAYEIALDQTKDPDIAFSAGVAALPSAVIDVIGDKIVGGRMLKNTQKAALSSLSGAAKREYITELLKDSSIRRSLLEGALGEGLSEMGGDIAFDIGVESQTGIPTATPDQKKKQYMESFALGAILGGFASGASTAITRPDSTSLRALEGMLASGDIDSAVKYLQTGKMDVKETGDTTEKSETENNNDIEIIISRDPDLKEYKDITDKITGLKESLNIDKEAKKALEDERDNLLSQENPDAARLKEVQDSLSDIAKRSDNKYKREALAEIQALELNAAKAVNNVTEVRKKLSEIESVEYDSVEDAANAAKEITDLNPDNKLYVIKKGDKFHIVSESSLNKDSQFASYNDIPDIEGTSDNQDQDQENVGDKDADDTTDNKLEDFQVVSQPDKKFKPVKTRASLAQAKSFDNYLIAKGVFDRVKKLNPGVEVRLMKRPDGMFQLDFPKLNGNINAAYEFSTTQNEYVESSINKLKNLPLHQKEETAIKKRDTMNKILPDEAKLFTVEQDGKYINKTIREIENKTYSDTNDLKNDYNKLSKYDSDKSLQMVKFPNGKSKIVRNNSDRFSSFFAIDKKGNYINPNAQKLVDAIRTKDSKFRKFSRPDLVRKAIKSIVPNLPSDVVLRIAKDKNGKYYVDDIHSRRLSVNESQDSLANRNTILYTGAEYIKSLESWDSTKSQSKIQDNIDRFFSDDKKEADKAKKRVKEYLDGDLTKDLAKDQEIDEPTAKKAVDTYKDSGDKKRFTEKSKKEYTKKKNEKGFINNDIINEAINKVWNAIERLIKSRLISLIREDISQLKNDISNLFRRNKRRRSAQRGSIDTGNNDNKIKENTAYITEYLPEPGLEDEGSLYAITFGDFRYKDGGIEKGFESELEEKVNFEKYVKETKRDLSFRGEIEIKYLSNKEYDELTGRSKYGDFKYDESGKIIHDEDQGSIKYQQDQELFRGGDNSGLYYTDDENYANDYGGVNSRILINNDNIIDLTEIGTRTVSLAYLVKTLKELGANINYNDFRSDFDGPVWEHIQSLKKEKIKDIFGDYDAIKWVENGPPAGEFGANKRANAFLVNPNKINQNPTNNISENKISAKDKLSGFRLNKDKSGQKGAIYNPFNKTEKELEYDRLIEEIPIPKPETGKVFYHNEMFHGGTARDLSSIKASKDGGSLGNGIYFTPSKSRANQYAKEAGGKILQSNVVLNNPLVVKSDKRLPIEVIILMDFGFTEQNALNKFEKANESKGYITSEFQSLSKTKGKNYDGIIQLDKNGNISELVVWDKGSLSESTFTRTISGAHKFTPESYNKINGSYPPSYKSRAVLVPEMPIDDFLALAYPIQSELETDLSNVIQFDEIPFLQIDRNGKIFGHEGRNRAMQLKKEGYSTMPVDVISSNIRWSQQGDPNNIDYVEDFPTKITNEKGDKSYDFPFDRHGNYTSISSGFRLNMDKSGQKGAILNPFNKSVQKSTIDPQAIVDDPDIKLSDIENDFSNRNSLGNQFSRFLRNAWRDIRDFYNDNLRPISERLGDYDYRLKLLIRLFEGYRRTMQNRYYLPFRDFVETARKSFSPQEYNALEIAALRNDMGKFERIVNRSPLVKEKWNKHLNARDALIKEAELHGIETSGFVSGFPIYFKDIKAFERYTGKNSRTIKALQDARLKAAENGETLTKAQEAKIINDFLLTDIRSVGKSSGINVINHIEDDMMEYIESPFDSMYKLITDIGDKASKRRLFGKDSLREGEDFTSTFGDLITKLLEEGKISESDVYDIKKLVSARLFAVPSTGLTRGLTNIAYSVAMGNFVAAMTQAQDIFTPAIFYGADVTADAFHHNYVTLEQINDVLSAELGAIVDNKNFTDKLVDTLLTINGVTKVDRIAKAKIMSLAVSNIKLNAKKSDAEWNQYITNYIDIGMFQGVDPNGFRQWISKLDGPLKREDESTGDVTDAYNDIALSLAFMDVLEFQPAAKSELPMNHLTETGMTRHALVLKLFMIRQLTTIAQRTIPEIKAAYKEGRYSDIKKPATQLFSILLLMSLAGATKDQLWAFIFDKDEEFNESFSDNLLGIVGLNRYYVNQAERGGWASAIKSFFTPAAISISSDTVGAFADGNPLKPLARVVPFGLGNIYRWRFTDYGETINQIVSHDRFRSEYDSNVDNLLDELSNLRSNDERTNDEEKRYNQLLTFNRAIKRYEDLAFAHIDSGDRNGADQYLNEINKLGQGDIKDWNRADYIRKKRAANDKKYKENLDNSDN